ncbi:MULTISPECIES: peptidoglycan-binding domain-containing protein [unclassified Beijerinckia]|uniref:peptidoglycan-binding domain-containing protein n=1 Tax=unclassified Beijerinckia TaxID=2638183 RepID=UPI000897FE15|nr:MULTISPECIES: peptidoglycan-binding domain-containing protein [unclassified Beijerinckia]MDH7797414.1 hypothetical protein [Beijerinckia sp. GAS462]SEC84522.1 Putative peptidoglycan binding domain-containing protein [Beijerinckia sp. 28-YEA-48]
MAFTTASALRVISLLLAATALPGHSLAQQPAPAAAAPDPAFEAAKSAFEALPDADRRALQDALVWTGDYKGNVDGNFGRGTRDAIVAYARRSKLPTDGTLDPKARALLVAAGEKIRNAQAFRKVVDTRSGVAIGLPTKAMSKRTDTKTGSTWSTADGAAAIDTFQNAEAESDLPRLFEILRGDGPGRKVTYRVLRPDFLVITGEEGERVFYTRAARGMANGVPTVRGYTLSYARRLRPTYDVLSIAVANAFEPFPSAAAPSSATAPVVSAAPSAPASQLEASAIAIGPGLFLTVLGRDCTDPKIGGRAATITRRDADTGLALVEARGAEIAAVAPAASTPNAGDSLVALFAAQMGGRDAEIVVATGNYVAPVGTGVPRLVAPLQGRIGGTAIFDRSGALVALAAAPANDPVRYAGIVPQAAWKLIPASAATKLMNDAGVKPVVLPAGIPAPRPDRTAGDIAAQRGRSLQALMCTR